MAASNRYYCHQCEAEVNLTSPDSIQCPTCDGEFLEAFVSQPLASVGAIMDPSPAGDSQNPNTTTASSRSSSSSNHLRPNEIHLSFHISAFPSPSPRPAALPASASTETTSQHSNRPSANTNASSIPINSLVNWVLQGIFGSSASQSSTTLHGDHQHGGEQPASTATLASIPTPTSNEERRRPRSPSLSEESSRSQPTNPHTRIASERRPGLTAPIPSESQPFSIPTTVTSFEQLFGLVHQLVSHSEGLAIFSSTNQNTPLPEWFSSVFPMPDTIGDYAVGPNAFDNIITRLMDTEAMQNAPPPASENAMERLPRFQLTNQRLERASDCAVCKEDFAFNDLVIELPCLHFFHEACILPWLRRNGTCPVCRYAIDR